MLNGAQILLECLLEQNVTAVFGYPGAAVMPVYSALKQYGSIKHYLTAHELGAAHAADGYARRSGRPGVCLATSGPGATNLVTGIATAYMDSSPLVAVTGNVALPFLGKDSFQEVDIAGITMPVTKHNYIVKDIKDLAKTVRAAFNVAASGRPGPVLVDILKNVFEQTAAYKKMLPAPVIKTQTFAEEDLANAAAFINSAERPVILLGGGVILAGAWGEAKRLAEKMNAPVCVTAMGIGSFPTSHELYAGMAGIYGTASANRLLAQADLVVAVGARFSERVTSGNAFNNGVKVLHLDADAAEIDKNVASACCLIGDAKAALENLSPFVKNKWVKNVRKWFTIDHGNFINNGSFSPPAIFEIINKLKGGAVITTEVGQHQMWACRLLKGIAPRGFITSGGLGTMGFGLPAGIGAAVAGPGTSVINIAGDGCFRMNNTELATAVENNAPLTNIIFNNHALGMVRTGLETKRTDFVKLAEAYGAKAYRVTNAAEFEQALAEALRSKTTNVIDCEMDKDGLEWM